MEAAVRGAWRLRAQSAAHGAYLFFFFLFSFFFSFFACAHPALLDCHLKAAMRKSMFDLAEECLAHAKDYSGQLLMYSCVGACTLSWFL